jgi:trehalose 6-phosphate phosphatase
MRFSDYLCADCALFLDFDGTLVEIAAHPEAVRVPAGLVGTLGRLQRLLGGAVAVVSGRPIAQIDGFLDPLALCVAGVHGAERRRADGSRDWLPVPPLQPVEDCASALVREHPALRLETKRGSLALHYRQAPQLEGLCLHAMAEAVARAPGLALLRGKMVVEAKPAQATKGQAIEAFLREPPFAGRTPIFVGDDVTDEPGFAVVQALGGVGVKVGPGPTVAMHRMADPAAMRDAMERAIATHGGAGATP